MSSQQRIPSGSSHDRATDVQAPATVASQPAASGVDDLLDEIDSLLEENAEAFVKSFVQKGGQ